MRAMEQTHRHNLTIHQRCTPMMNMEGGEDKKLNFRCCQIAVVEGTFVDEDDEAQTHRHNLTIYQKMYPHDT